MKLNVLNGIGEKTEKIFNRAGIFSVDDLLTYYPRYYDVFNAPVHINDLEIDMIQAIKGTVVRQVTIKKVNNLHIVSTFIRDEQGDVIKAVWFNAAYLKTQIRIGDVYIFRGHIKESKGSYQIEQPKLYSLFEYNKKMGEMQPVYPLVSGMTNNMISKAIKQAFDYTTPEEILPETIRNKYNLEDIKRAIYDIHYPMDKNAYISARQRLVFEEFFKFIYSLRTLKENNEKIINHNIFNEPKEIKKLIEKLPYELTKAQIKTWNEIKKDISSDYVMNRLVQGDVGCGKTIIAILALFTAALNGSQGAIMAPTEVLALQHYENIAELISKNNLDIKPILLVGSMTAKEKREAYEQIADGSVNVIVGTHALIQEKVTYNNLGLVVTDEQHRFGVRQRETISIKGNNPHVMVMSATPIPRTLAIIIYGDLDISVIDELPANRLPIANCVVDNSYRPNAYDFIQKQINQGRQVYIICPTVEYSEAVEGENVIEYANKLKQIFPPNINISYLHGRMKPAEKNNIMNDFAENKIQILVSTTVVEVGVNVPNATVMMVENAERFGLAQLHQLRGRVGRGKYQSYCIFVNGSNKNNAKERLEILCKSNDGFFIANEDLKLRGPGDFFGVRQSGDFEFKLGDIMNDVSILKDASEAVDLIQKGILDISQEEVKMIYKYSMDMINI